MGKHKLVTEADLKKRPKKKINIPKKTLIAISAVSIAVLIIGAWLITCVVSAHTLLNPERKGLELSDGPLELGMVYSTRDTEGINEGDQLIYWWIPSQDHLGEYVPSDKTLIVSHNYGSNREMIEISAIYLIEDIVHAGYNVVMFDYSGSGNAEGSDYTFGADEAKELSLLVDHIKEEYDQKDIGVIGWGFGAAAAIVAGSENDNVSFIIADSSYLDLREYLETELSVWSGLSDFLFSPVILPFMEMMSGCDFECNTIDAVSEAEGKSYLFIHGLQDYIFPSENSEALYRAAGENNFADIVFFNSRHIYGLMDYEENYINEILGFLEDQVGGGAVTETETEE